MPRVHVPPLQVRVARVLPSAQVVPQSLPSALASQPEPSPLQRPVRQALFPQDAAAQQRPPMQVRPPAHWPLLPPQLCPCPRVIGSQPFVLGLQTVPVPHLMGAHVQPVLAEQVLQPPPQAESQQWPFTQAPERQSPPATHAPPGPCWTVMQRSFWHTCPAPQEVVLVWQAPLALQVPLTRVPSAAQLGAWQVAPATSCRQPPIPSQPLRQALSGQVPVGSAPRWGTRVQVPSEPGSAHDWHTPSHAVLQQRPWAQMPAPPHSSSREQAAPMGRLPQDPFWHEVPATHWAWPLQKVRQWLPWQPWKGAHDCGAGTAQLPFLQVPTSVALFEVPSQLAGWHTVPFGYRWQPRLPSQRPLVPQDASPWSTQAPLPPLAARGSTSFAGTATQRPGLLGKAQ